MFERLGEKKVRRCWALKCFDLTLNEGFNKIVKEYDFLFLYYNI